MHFSTFFSIPHLNLLRSGLFIIFIFSKNSICTGQGSHHIFEHLTTDHGLSSNKVEAILQDRQGFYWIATQNGLNRFDGTTFKVFHHDVDDTTSLSHNHCTALAEDQQGDIWIATYKGVSRFQKSKGHFQRIYLTHPIKNFELTNRIYNLTVDSSGNIWIAGNGLWKYDAGSNQITLFQRNPTDASTTSIYSIIIHLDYDKANHGLWFNSGNGLCYFNIFTSEFYHKDFNPHRWRIFDNAENGELTLDPKNRLWFRDEESQCLSYFDRTQNKIVVTPKKITQGIKHIRADDKGRIWIFYWLVPAEIFSVECFTTDTGFFSIQHRRSVLSPQANSLYVDKFNNYWIASGKGISIYRDVNQYYALHEIHMDDPENKKEPLLITAMAQNEPDLLWISTNKGLILYHLKTGRIQPVKLDKPYRHVTTLLADDDKLWLGANDQLLCMDIHSMEVLRTIRVKPKIYFLRKGREEDLWIGFWTDGLCRLNKRTGELQYYVKTGDSAQTLISNSLITGFFDGEKFWTGYNAGLGFSAYSQSTDIWSHFHPQEDEVANSNAGTITSITKTPGGQLWLGTYGGGIFSFDPWAMRYMNYNQNHGLSSNYINSMIPDGKGNLWISTADGMNYLDAASNRIRPLNTDLVFRNNDLVTNGILGLNGKLYFFCLHEFVEIDPALFDLENTFPQLVISGFAVFDQDKPLPAGHQGIRLSYRENFFSFNFSIIKTHPLIKAGYRYILQGFDKDWVTTDRAFASYTNVPEGKYIFQVKAYNDEGAWSEPLLKILIHIKPPFWRTWWFISLCILFVTSGFYLFYRYRIQQIQKLYAVRTKISRDLHDDIGASLSSIHFSSSIAEQEVSDNPKKVKELLQQISSNSRHVIENISDIIWANHTGQLENSSLAARIKNYGYDLLSLKNIDCTYKIDSQAEKKLTNPEARRNILLIIKEAMNNIAKYSKAEKAEVRVTMHGAHLLVEISDDGAGFEISSAKTGNGLTNMRKRTDSLNGSCTIQSSPGKGTAIQCRIPIPNISDM